MESRRTWKATGRSDTDASERGWWRSATCPPGDEALGCFMLRKTKRFQDADVVRSRNPEVHQEADVVLDVGAEYAPDRFRFDHHQREFGEVFGRGFDTKLSSAGLVYKHFGKEIIANELGLEEEDPKVDLVWIHVYRNFVEAVDAIDNGINRYDTDAPPKYADNTGLSSRVGSLNPEWYEPSGPDEQMTRFRKAMELAGKEFMDAVYYVAKVWLPAREIVQDSIQNRFQVDESGCIAKLSQYCPWKSHMEQLEAEQGREGSILYCLYEDQAHTWRIQALAARPGSFESRKALPVEWRGLRDEELSKQCGIEGCIFVHSSGFIGGNRTYEGALAMARKAVSM